MPNAVTLFTETLLKAGIETKQPIIGDGHLHRSHVVGDKAGSLNLAYVLHLDGNPAGWYQYFKTGISGKWTLSGKREPLSNALLKQINYAEKVRQTEQDKAHQQAAEKARLIWNKATPISAESQCPYLTKKRVKPHGARLYKGMLVIPLHNEHGEIVNLQFIAPNGDKRFLSGGKKKGCYYLIGVPTPTVLISEGFATGVSLYEATGLQTVIAFDAGNLAEVSARIRNIYPATKIIVCGDNDLSGVGQKKARNAALTCNGKYMIPPKVGQDFNDFINAGGVVYG